MHCCRCCRCARARACVCACLRVCYSVRSVQLDRDEMGLVRQMLAKGAEEMTNAFAKIDNGDGRISHAEALEALQAVEAQKALQDSMVDAEETSAAAYSAYLEQADALFANAPRVSMGAMEIDDRDLREVQVARCRTNTLMHARTHSHTRARNFAHTRTLSRRAQSAGRPVGDDAPAQPHHRVDHAAAHGEVGEAERSAAPRAPPCIAPPTCPVLPVLPRTARALRQLPMPECAVCTWPWRLCTAALTAPLACLYLECY